MDGQDGQDVFVGVRKSWPYPDASRGFLRFFTWMDGMDRIFYGAWKSWAHPEALALAFAGRDLTLSLPEGGGTGHALS